MVSDHQLSRSEACKFVDLLRPAFYKPNTDWAAKDAPSVDALNAIVAARAHWGFWKSFTRMRRDDLPWNHKRVYRVYCDIRLNIKRQPKRRPITRERQPPGGSTQLKQVWALDSIRDTLYDGRPFRTVNVIDEGNREALRIECETSIPSARHGENHESTS
jgi:putative transposase